MLSELYIRNFAIIDEIRLRFDSGFNVLTGETGAGKSIILDAVELVLGERADTTMVRSGASEAIVEASFSLTDPVKEQLVLLLEQEGLEGEDDELVSLARELRSNGRTISRVNGRTVSLGLLRQIAQPLIDIHGQGDHLSLLKPSSHLPLLDVYAGLGSERIIVSREVDRFTSLQRELDGLRRDERLMTQRMDMLQFQIREIDAANLEVGEDEKLREERNRLANVEQLVKYSSEAAALLGGVVDDDGVSIVDQLGQVERLLGHLVRYDDSQASRLEAVQGFVFQLGELAADLQEYLEALEFSPGRLDYVEERLELINTLKRKYGESIPTILELRHKAADELEQLGGSQERIGALEIERDRLLHQIGGLALSLSEKRKKAAQELAAAVEGHLADLKMDGSQFSVDFSLEPAADGAYVDMAGEQRSLAFDRSGIDRVEFLISANPGEPLKPMAKVASGGETSRLMLALKTVLTEADATPTLIFDEIDQGIGGRVGDVAGRKLWALTTSARHQVIVVTHLPQLAGYADRHFRVLKEVKAGRTITAVMNLDTPGRIQELAAMLGTRGEHAQGGAESILQQVKTVKAELA